MAQLTAVLEDLKQERTRLNRELKQLDSAINAIGKVVNNGFKGDAHQRRGSRKMSVAARKRIAAAQRARWAKLRASKRAT
jgi:hypothetical protein